MADDDGAGPARSAVRYERVLLNGTAAPNNELEGRPGSEVDKFWDDLLECEFTLDL